MNYRDLIPPIVARKLSAAREARGRTFASYAEALRASGAGYNDDELATVVLAKTKAANSVNQSLTAATLLALTIAESVSHREDLRVLDFGGAFGTSYFLVREAAAKIGLNLCWAVVENPTFARLGAEFESDSLRFFDSPNGASAWLGEVDLVYSSGALQYTPSPEESLKALIGLNAPAVALLRCALSSAGRVIQLQTSRLSQNGPGALPTGVRDRKLSYPRTFAVANDLRATCERSYHLVSHADEGAVRFIVGGQPVVTGESFIWIKSSRSRGTLPRP